MEVKCLEVRDEGTFIAVVAINMNPTNEEQRYLLRRCGYPCDGRPNIAISELGASGRPMWNDPHAWGGRTYPVAHDWIIKAWDTLKDGDVIDVQFIIGETTKRKVSERVTAPL